MNLSAVHNERVIAEESWLEPPEEHEEGHYLTCHTCGKIVAHIIPDHPVDEHPLEFDVWFNKEDSPTGEIICGECFDELPCEDCKGI